MRGIRTITISLPMAMGKEIETLAKEEHRTVSELIREVFRQYRAQRNLASLSAEGRKKAKARKLKPEDLGLESEE